MQASLAISRGCVAGLAAAGPRPSLLAMTDETIHADATPVVLYNGDCPICSREIAAYRRAATRTGAALEFEDLNAADLARWGVSAEAARRRLHLRRGDELLVGLPAFVALWQALPRMRWLSWLVSLPLIRPLASFIYERTLAPALFALDRRRRRRCALSDRHAAR